MLHFRKKKPADKHNDRQGDAGAAPAAPDRDATPSAKPVSKPQDNAAPATPAPPAAPAGTVSADEAEEHATPPAVPRRSWRQRLSGSGFARGLSALFTHGAQLDDALLDELETVLITADVGVNASTELVEALRTRMHKREFADAGALLDALRRALLTQLAPVADAPAVAGTAAPCVVLVVGVNGVGKTTTIGKLAHRYRAAGQKVMLAAGDTFRAAAVEQLQAWGERNGVPVLAQGHGADAASVIYDALAAARARHSDVMIADTAGRLHTQGGLMDELAKIVRVMKKLDADAPHEVLMVIDGTTGQNAISQLRQFRAAVGVTGLVVTKLDGTAKGGVVFALAREFALPIRYVGLGEGIEDLRPFDPQAFVDGLLPASLGNAG